MNYCPWAKKISKRRELLESVFINPILYYKVFYTFACKVRDALGKLLRTWKSSPCRPLSFSFIFILAFSSRFPLDGRMILTFFTFMILKCLKITFLLLWLSLFVCFLNYYCRSTHTAFFRLLLRIFTFIY